MGYAAQFDIGGVQHPIASSLYGECTTAGGTAAKIVSLPNFDAFVPGVTIKIKFTYANTAANPTLNVNGTGALPIYRHGVVAPGTSSIQAWAANAVVSFTYDGAAWRMEEPFDLSAMNAYLKAFVLESVYPVGSIYTSTNSTSPATRFGGTWVQIKDRFLLAAGDSYAAGGTGGAATVTLTTANLPSHKHSIGAHAHGLNGHTHSVPAHAHGLNSHTHSIPALSGTAASNGAHTHKVKLKQYESPTGSGWNPFLTDADGSGYSGTTESAGAHTHTVSTNASTTGAASGNTANSAALTSGAASGNTANSTAFDSGATGSGTAVNKMPPYLVVYAWQRTA